MKIVLIGKAGSGKDTVADYLIEHHNFKKYAFANKIKSVALDLFPELWVSDKRNMLQQLGLKMREIDEGVWVKYLLSELETVSGNVIITDCRYRNEYDICTEKGYTTVKINCENKIRGERLFKRDGRRMTEGELNHVSEQLDVPCSYILENSGSIEHLYHDIELMIKGECI